MVVGAAAFVEAHLAALQRPFGFEVGHVVKKLRTVPAPQAGPVWVFVFRPLLVPAHRVVGVGADELHRPRPEQQDGEQPQQAAVSDYPLDDRNEQQRQEGGGIDNRSVAVAGAAVPVPPFGGHDDQQRRRSRQRQERAVTRRPQGRRRSPKGEQQHRRVERQPSRRRDEQSRQAFPQRRRPEVFGTLPLQGDGLGRQRLPEFEGAAEVMLVVGGQNQGERQAAGHIEGQCAPVGPQQVAADADRRQGRGRAAQHRQP